MKKIAKIFCFFFLISYIFIFNVYAKNNVKQDIFLKKCELIKKMFPKMKIDSVHKSPIPGLCEIWSGLNVIYYQPDKKLLFFGEIWDTKGESLTLKTKNKILALRVKKLPLKNAIRWGNGKVRVILFTDPDCPFCRRVESFLISPLFKKNIRAYIFLYPLGIHKNAKKHSIEVLCSKNPVKKLLSYIKSNETTDSIIINKSCREKAEYRLKEMKKTAEYMALTGTPMVIIGNKIVRGAQLEKIATLINKELVIKNK